MSLFYIWPCCTWACAVASPPVSSTQSVILALCCSGVYVVQLIAIQQCHVHKVEEYFLPAPHGSADMINLAVTQIHTKHVLIVINNALWFLFHNACSGTNVHYASRRVCAQHQHRFFLRLFFMERDDQHVFPAVVQAFPNVEFFG